jgi:hypothetical protein
MHNKFFNNFPLINKNKTSKLNKPKTKPKKNQNFLIPTTKLKQTNKTAKFNIPEQYPNKKIQRRKKMKK